MATVTFLIVRNHSVILDRSMNAVLHKRLRTVAMFTLIATVGSGLVGFVLGEIDGAKASDRPLIGVLIGVSADRVTSSMLATT